MNATTSTTNTTYVLVQSAPRWRPPHEDGPPQGMSFREWFDVRRKAILDHHWKEWSKLTHKHPVHMTHWNTSASGEDRLNRTLAYRLEKQGWKGCCVALTSPFEERAIEHFVSSLTGDHVRRKPAFVQHDSDERPGDIGRCTTRSHAIWFANEGVRDAFRLLYLDALPKRTLEKVFTTPPNKRRLAQWLRGKNWLVIKGEKGWLLSVEANISDAVRAKIEAL